MTIKTYRKFIGILHEGYFKIISSVIGKGAFCVFEGSIVADENTGTIHIQIHKTFRLLILFWFISIITIAIAFSVSNPLIALKTIVFMTMVFFALKLIILPLIFKRISMKGLDELIQILGIVNLEELK